MYHLPGNYGDFLFMVAFVYMVSLVGQAILNFGGWLLLYQSFSFAITYIFCRKSPDQEFKVLMLLKLKAHQFIWFDLVFRLMIGQTFWNLIVGLVAGHLYIYLKEILPLSHRKTYLRTPVLL